MASVAMLAACATAWNGSTSAGGGHSARVGNAVEEVAAVTPMTPLCKVVGKRLVEVSVARKVSNLRPTSGYWQAKEEKAAGAWEAAQCPVSALAALVYAASEIANDDARRRVATASSD
jgi:hypothetical protein